MSYYSQSGLIFQWVDRTELGKSIRLNNPDTNSRFVLGNNFIRYFEEHQKEYPNLKWENCVTCPKHCCVDVDGNEDTMKCYNCPDGCCNMWQLIPTRK